METSCSGISRTDLKKHKNFCSVKLAFLRVYIYIYIIYLIYKYIYLGTSHEMLALAYASCAAPCEQAKLLSCAFFD